MIDKLRTGVRDNLWTIITYAISAGMVGVLLYWRLGSLAGGYAPDETQAYQFATHPSNFVNNPLNAPFYGLVKVFSLVFGHNFVAGRVAAATIGLALIVAFFVAVRLWHGRLVGTIASIMFASSAWFLHTARLGLPEVLYMLLGMLILCGFWLVHKYSPWVLTLCVLLFITLLYVPGMIWFIAAGILWQWRAITEAFKRHTVLVAVAMFMCIVALAPLAWAFYNDMSLVRVWLGLPQSIPTLSELGKNILYVPTELYAYHKIDAQHWLGTISLLDIFSGSMVLLGAYLYARNIRLGRTQVIVLALIIGWALVSLGGSMNVVVLLPFVYLLAAAGLDYLLSEWFTVFPRNPIARSIGLGLVCFVLLMACTYNLRHYFVGWPQAGATQEIFIEHDSPQSVMLVQ
jgi:hypothetical protein